LIRGQGTYSVDKEDVVGKATFLPFPLLLDDIQGKLHFIESAAR